MTVAAGGKLPNVWTGVSTDTKPSSGTIGGPIQNDIFFETDTRNTYVYVSNTNSWVIWNPFVSLYTLLAGEKNPNSQVNGYIDQGTNVYWTRLSSTSALNVSSGAFVGSSPYTAGVIGDTRFLGAHILANGAAVTLTVSGFADDTGAVQSDVYTGSTTVDSYVLANGIGLLNNAAPMTVTASVAAKVWVALRPA